jgi:hypothetical protein
MKDAGAIPIEKMKVPEFSYWTETDNSVSRKTLNPYNVVRTSGWLLWWGGSRHSHGNVSSWAG